MGPGKCGKPKRQKKEKVVCLVWGRGRGRKEEGGRPSGCSGSGVWDCETGRKEEGIWGGGKVGGANP